MQATQPIVYLASPYSRSDQCLNVRAQHAIFHRLMVDGVVYPHAPLWSHYQNLHQPMAWEEWLKLDEALILRFDALYRFPATHPAMDYYAAESKGADREEEFCRTHGIPVFYAIDRLYMWAKYEYTPPALVLERMAPIEVSLPGNPYGG